MKINHILIFWCWDFMAVLGNSDRHCKKCDTICRMNLTGFAVANLNMSKMKNGSFSIYSTAADMNNKLWNCFQELLCVHVN